MEHSEADPETPDAADNDLPRASVSTRVATFLLCCFAAYFARTLLIPIVTALFLYLTLRPVQRSLRRRHIPNSVAAFAITALLALGLGASVYTVFQPARQMFAEAPTHLETVKHRLDFVFDKINSVNEATEELSKATEESSDDESSSDSDGVVPVEVRQPAWSTNFVLLSGTGNLLSAFAVVAVLLFFLLATGDELLAGIMDTLPSFSARLELLSVLEKAEQGLSGYFGRITAINFCLGIAVGLAMWLLGMPTPVMWGGMAMLFNFVPVLGAMAGCVVILLVAVVSFESTGYSFFVASCYFCLTALEGQIITPAVLGKSMNVSPVMVVVSLLFWGWMWGLAGIFLAVPILIVMRFVCDACEVCIPTPMDYDSADLAEPAASRAASTHKQEAAKAVEKARFVTRSGTFY